MRKLIILLLLTSFKVSFCFAQSKMTLFEDSLKNLGTIFTNDTLQENRTQANYKFIKTLVNALKEKNSFNYPFLRLQSFISVKKDDENKFRIFSWFTQNNDGTYRYYGAIQLNNPNKLELYPLLDDTQELSRSENLKDSTLATNQWYGAVYYNILPVTGIKDPYYILFGWKGKNLQSSSKVLETLHFKDGKPEFGVSVLEDSPKSNRFDKRIIFSYTKDASMLLRYAKDDKLIVFDHLVATNDQSKAFTDLYAPDLSYDA
ncbi:hypothetical protein N9R54_05575, partial [Pelobium sp.]